jgi:hypothetical protein
MLGNVPKKVNEGIGRHAGFDFIHRGISGYFLRKLSVRVRGDADLHFLSTMLQGGLSAGLAATSTIMRETNPKPRPWPAEFFSASREESQIGTHGAALIPIQYRGARDVNCLPGLPCPETQGEN